ncbi:S1C family serine protease [Roseibacillus persicicus]|uniref:Serine protease n=1 Tax=Roseibacillus persicicus TaxID=454148 RepID=A0A918TXF8_9BACT|nr:trypsin-like peptidase domain-containing protein [Roseibacillus persicicus]MDQ8190943.1 trypsin-like peptidase domain-containing protein [Roseibacillus persicicus]GHC64715.1 serine protease [Roseibacillus persicicus]
MIIRTLFCGLVGLSPLAAQLAPPAETVALVEKKPAQAATLFDSVLRIEVATQNPDYGTPWNAGGFSGGNGTGFLIGPNQILTNAHVVSNARRILVTQRNSARKLPATIQHIAHDCDLALISLDDPAPLEGLIHLPIGGMPELDSEVRAIGYPVGGDRLSVTRGIVSRIDFRPYSHSRSDSHLIIQVDAAINPGNSGGPAIQGDKVIGVAFQGLTQADNTGYIIPTPVINRFLTDIEDGRYDKYMDLGLTSFPLFNPAMRKALGLPDDDRGVLVTGIIPDGPCDGFMQENDILLAIDGNPIDSAGNITVDGETLVLHEIVERKFAKDTVKLDFLRDGSRQSAEIILKPLPGAPIFTVIYGERPEYIFYGGLVIQPLTLNAMSAHRLTGVTIRHLTTNYLNKAIFRERPEILVLTRVESDELTANMGGFTDSVINTINGEKVRDLKHAYELLYEKEQPEFTVIEFENMGRPLVIPSAKVEAVNQRLMKTNNIPSNHYLGE